MSVLPERLPEVPGTRGLTHWWPLNDSFGGKNYPLVGSVYGTDTLITPADGPPFAAPNSAANFTAATSQIALSAAPHDFGGSSTTPFTISFWVYLNSFTTLDSASTLGRMICWGASPSADEICIMCGSGGNGSVEVKFREDGAAIVQQITAAGVFALGVWNHFVGVTSDGSTQQFYINGAPVALSNGGNSVTSAEWNFGCRSTGLRTINGRMADVRFCKGTAWTAAEVADLYNSSFVQTPEMPALFVSSGAPSGTLAVTETPDTASFAGDVVVSGTLATTETADTAAFNGSVVVSGTLAVTETTDTAAFNGFVGVSGSLATTDTTDIAAFNGGVLVSGTLGVTEAADVAAFNGSVVVSGTLVVTEGTDTAAFNGTIGGVLSGTLVVTDTPDVAVFSGDIVVSGSFVTTDTPDIAFFIQQTPSGGRWVEDLKKHKLHDIHKVPVRTITYNLTHSEDVRKAAAVLSSLGGHARAEALTAKERTNIAKKAANTRWR